MGEEAAFARGPLSDKIVVGMPFVAETAAALAERHGLKPSAKLEELLDHLFGLSCRDQNERSFDPERMAERRRQGYSLAKSMRKEAAAMLASLEALYRDWKAFDEQVQFEPALLQAIFKVDLGTSENMFLPPEISTLQSLFRKSYDDSVDELQKEPFKPSDLTALTIGDPCPSGLWEAVDRRLAAVAELPIRSRLPGGPVPNQVVRDALSLCQPYWAGAHKAWSMAALKNADVRYRNRISNLTGKCEKFVADVLTATGIRFTLHELQSAWEKVDAERRNAKGDQTRLE